MAAAAAVLALAGGAAAVPLGPVGGVAQAQVAPIPQDGVRFGQIRDDRGDWRAEIFFDKTMVVSTVAHDFVPQESNTPFGQLAQEAELGDPVFDIIPASSTFTLEHYELAGRTPVLKDTYDVVVRTSTSTTPSGLNAIRLEYELPDVTVNQNDRLALVAPGKGTEYPKPLRGGSSRFSMPYINTVYRGHVRVHNPDSDPVGTPRVVVTKDGNVTEPELAEDYSFLIELGATSGTYTVEVVPPEGFATPPAKTVDITSGAADRDFDVYPITVSGTLVDDSGTPVTGASVTVAGRPATSGADGTFTVNKVPVGTHDVVVGATAATLGTKQSGVSVRDRKDNQAGTITVPAKPQVGTVAGQVRDPSGNGVAGVKVRAGGKTGTTGADGRYSVADVPTGQTTVEVLAAPTAYVLPSPEQANVSAGKVSAVNFKMELKPTPKTTTPRTSTSTPKPTPKTTTPRTSTSTPKPTPTTTTPRTSTSTPKPTPKTTTPRTSTTTPKPTPKTTTTTAPRVGDVSGSVVDATGQPVPGATVTAHDTNGKAFTVAVDADGQFELTDLPPGQYVVSIGVPRGLLAPEPVEVNVKAGKTVSLPTFVVHPEKAQFAWGRVQVAPGETKVTVPTRSGNTTTEPNFRTSTVTQARTDGTTAEIPAEESWISVERDGTVVARPPRDAAPGEYRVEVADAAGDAHVITVEVTEPAPMSSLYAVRFPVIPVPAGTSRQAGRPRATVKEGPFTYADRRLPEGTRFAVDPKHRGWVRVDATGRLTFSPPLGTAPGPRKVAVDMTFPDGSSRTYNAEVEIGDPLLASTTALGFEDGLSVRPGKAVTVMRTGATALPEGTTFEVDRTEPLGGWVAVVDERNGNLRVYAPQQGEAVEVPVVAYFSDGSSTRLTAGVRLSTSSALSAAHNPSYPGVKAEPGSTATVPLSGTVPEGTAFDVVDGGGLREVGVDRHSGTLAVELPADAQLDSPYTVTVRVRYGDGSTEEITAKITAVSEAVRFSPRVSGSLAEIGDSVVVRTGLPSGAKLVGFNHDGWNVDYNSDTGELTVAPSTDVPHGSVIKVPLEVRFSDGSTTVVEYPVTATGKGAPAKTGGSSENGGWIAVVLGALAALAGLGFAVYLNQDAINALLKQYGF